MARESKINLLRNSSGLLETDFWTHTGLSLDTLTGDVDNNVKKGVGTGCVLVLENSGNSAVFADSNSFKVKPNTAYNISGYYYVGLNCSGINIQIKGVEDGSSTILCEDTTYSSGNYKYFSTNVTTSASAKSAYIEISNLGGGSGKKVYFGQIMVQEGTSDIGWMPNPNEIADNSVRINGNEIVGPYKSSDGQYKTNIEEGIIYITNNDKNGLMMRGDQTAGRVSIYKDGSLVGDISMSENYGTDAFEVHSEKSCPLALSNNKGAYFLLSGNNIYYNGNLVSGSDLRMKKDVSDIDKNIALSVVKGINPVEFRYNSLDNSKHLGVIAQDLEAVLNDCGINTKDYSIIKIDENGNYSVNYIEIIPLLIKSVQSLQEQVENLSR